MPSRSRAWWGPLAAALVLMIVIAYLLWGPGRRDDGPLLAWGEGGLVCLQKRATTSISFGFNALRNTGDTPLVLQDIHLVAPVGVTMVSAEVVPVKNNLIGAATGYPPPADALGQPGVDWGARRPLAGATLGADHLNLLVRLARASDRDVTGFDALRIDYEADGNEYVASTTVRFRIRPSCDVPDRATYD